MNTLTKVFFSHKSFVFAGGMILCWLISVRFVLSDTEIRNTVRGRIIDTFSEKPVEGVKLQFFAYPAGNLIHEYMTDSSGYYYREIIQEKKLTTKLINLIFRGSEQKSYKTYTGWFKVIFSHPGYYRAVRYSKGMNVLNTDIIPLTFDMELFDMWCRASPQGSIPLQRWIEKPKWFIYTGPAIGSDIEITREKIDLVKEIIQKDLVKFTHGFINGAHIEEGEETQLDNLEGWVLIYWSDTGGPGYHSVYVNGNIIFSAIVQLSTTWFYRRTYLGELTKILGLTHDVDTLNIWNNDGYYLPEGYDVGKILYSRPHGSMSPDEDPAPF